MRCKKCGSTDINCKTKVKTHPELWLNPIVVYSRSVVSRWAAKKARQVIAKLTRHGIPTWRTYYLGFVDVEVPRRFARKASKIIRAKGD